MSGCRIEEQLMMGYSRSPKVFLKLCPRFHVAFTGNVCILNEAINYFSISGFEALGAVNTIL
jgi:hypothetical protein